MTDDRAPSPSSEARAEKAERLAREAAQARADAAADISARDANTARLKALRLERDRVDNEAAAIASAKAPPKKAKAPVVRKKRARSVG